MSLQSDERLHQSVHRDGVKIWKKSPTLTVKASKMTPTENISIEEENTHDSRVRAVRDASKLLSPRRQQQLRSSKSPSPSSDNGWHHNRVRRSERRRRSSVATYCEDDDDDDAEDVDANEDEDAGGVAVYRDYECPKCARRFPAKRFLAEHKRPDAKKCRLCCKRFRHYSNLTNHMRVHTGEKPFSCGACGRAFTQLGNLRTHIRVHSGEKPYGCDMCRRRFTQVGQLATHRRTHDASKSKSSSESAGTACQKDLSLLC